MAADTASEEQSMVNSGDSELDQKITEWLSLDQVNSSWRYACSLI